MNRHKVAIFVWLMAVAVYAVAVAGRTSFGVAGLVAIDRFDINAATLSLFTVVQVGVYAAAQIPVGVLLDKYGPRIMLGSGALILAVGQIGMALSDTVGLALAARVLVGLGDATAFTSVIRIVPSWFSPPEGAIIHAAHGHRGRPRPVHFLGTVCLYVGERWVGTGLRRIDDHWFSDCGARTRIHPRYTQTMDDYPY